MQEAKNYKNSLKKICLAGVMAGLYVCLDYLAVSVSAPFGGSLKISLSGLPVIITAIFAGPIWGAAAGLIGAFIGQLITYGLSATTLLWVLPAVVRGLLFGILFIAFKKRTEPKFLILETCISSLVVTAINTAVMLIDQKIYGYGSLATTLATVPTRVIAGLVTAVLFSLMLPTIIDSLKKIMKI